MHNLCPLRTDWTEIVSHGDAPDATALRSHLRAVHRENAGFTERCAMRCRDTDGRTSYDWLIDAVDGSQHRKILDLACGSGPLLELCHQRFPAEVDLVGVDMAPEELALAKARLPVGRARLIEAQAQSMACLSDNSVDIVLCHWALTLMDPVAPVLAESARILAPGGRFAAIVDGDMDMARGYRNVHDLIYGYVQVELPQYGAFDLGDPRVRDTDSLADLTRRAFPTASVEVHPNVVTMRGSAETIAEEAAGFFYAAFVLPPDRRAAMLTDLAAYLCANMDQGEQASFAMPINRLVVTLP
ncbi:class I SAM-dependent methyltransferase [Actibacterium sp. 188UL27-1]|uniref:class I SAM-dependent methyltransferase n=1 Tax=Actibacterium sp. 188UL27-1 TaxID=2786961 RepID=UPI00195EF9D4|nr:class I SAM-dependent methyltransferase [Actibacterium sp. 188UL27-1]MBM7069000.1 class I SAM-dependent methyltransferase [Actibacterium sp. 188UL27-1]